MIFDKFQVLHSPWGLKRGKTNIFGSHRVRDTMRQLAAIETPARGLRMQLQDSPLCGGRKNITMLKNV